jgi:hypothetical protein
MKIKERNTPITPVMVNIIGSTAAMQVIGGYEFF